MKRMNEHFETEEETQDYESLITALEKILTAFDTENDFSENEE
ncbi:MAG: hypothetical protein ACRDDZ_06370 [Marinifilaceae bacterium]